MIDEQESTATLSAYFPQLVQVHEAVQRLRAANVEPESIRLVPGDKSDSPSSMKAEADKGCLDLLADSILTPEDHSRDSAGGQPHGYWVFLSVAANQHEQVLALLDA